MSRVWRCYHSSLAKSLEDTGCRFKLQSAYSSADFIIHGQTVDLSRSDALESELQTVFEQTVKSMGGDKLDRVIFTAGDALATMKLAEMTIERISRPVNYNFLPLFWPRSSSLNTSEKSHESSHTITTGSISERLKSDWSVIASYAGINHSMVRNLALDLNPIRANGVSPDVVDTKLWSMPKEQKDQLMEQMSKSIATGTPGIPELVAESFLGFMRDYNMDGATIRTDGDGLFM